MSVTPSFQGETQFVTFADSSKGGPRITLRLSEREDLEVFLGKEGKRYMCVLVEIGDDEQPLQPTAEVIHKEALGPAAYWLVRRCEEQPFRSWLLEQDGMPGSMKVDDVAAFVRDMCGVDSRREIDRNPEAMKRFQERIRGPYMKFMAANG